MGPLLKKIAKLVFGVALLSWLIHISDIGTILLAVKQYSPSVIAAAFSIFTLGLVIASLKWHALINGFKWQTLLVANFISQFYSMVLSGQMAGEAVKAYKISKGRDDVGPVVASIVADKLIGTLCLVLVGLLGAVFSENSPPIAITWFLASIAAGVIIGFFVISVPKIDDLVTTLLVAFKSRYRRFDSIISSLLDMHSSVLDYGRHHNRLFMCFCYGLIFQICNVIIIKLIASQLMLPLTFWDLAWIFAAVSMAVIVPISIGGIGLREGAFVALFGLFGISQELAITLSLTYFSLLLNAAFIGAILDFRWVAPATNRK